MGGGDCPSTPLGVAFTSDEPPPPQAGNMKTAINATHQYVLALKLFNAMFSSAK
jgi:hypothetical protein